ncbi:ABC transporter ATP-binding protein [Eubacteriaceae bacterium ES2]|nr:ABC transporter ATP-binding protein [Eubacteriaceae bacterium ES2]
MDKTMIKIKNVSKAYPIRKDQNLTAVNQVSLDILAGECLALVGESGCGKSTLGKLISGIERVTQGEIYFADQLISELKKKELRALRRQVQMVFQDPYQVFSPRMKIGPFLSEPLIHYLKLTKKDAWQRAGHLLEAVELNQEALKKFPHQLSGGQLQRVVIARAMALEPAFIVYDEVTSALDVSIQQQIIALIKRIHQEKSTTSIFISHDLALVQNLCDRIVVMYLGEIVEIIEREGLGRQNHHPYTRELLNSVFSLHGERNRSLNMIAGEPPSLIKRPAGCSFASRCSGAFERCLTEKPKLIKKQKGHFLACHRFEMVGEGVDMMV